MKLLNLQKLCCPACRLSYRMDVRCNSGDSIDTALLTCPSCCITIPVLHGFPIFDEQFLTDQPDFNQATTRLFGNEKDFLAFLDQKRTRPVYDLYAAFQPFNESTQCIFPLIPLLQEAVRPGDFILDLWCRTGWSGELLASMFPEQQVISIWESSSGLLGLKGFRYWLGHGKRRENLDIVFHSPNNPLPFSNQTFSIVHGLDTLHRYRHVPLIHECLRVVKESGMVVFPHNHLTNSEPEPYFDRGEDQMHGKEYERYFARLLEGSNRKAYVISEKTLFDSRKQYTLIDEPDTRHYNACILLADRANEGRTFRQHPKTLSVFKDAHVIVNPLWNIDLCKGEATSFPEAMDSGGETLFFRHPMYHARMKEHSPVRLEETDCLIIYWALRMKTVAQIASILECEPRLIFERLLAMESREVVQIQNVSEGMAKLQSYYCRQQVPCDSREATLTNLWNRTVALYAEKPFLLWPRDDSVFTYADTDTIVRMTAAYLKHYGVSKGDKVLIDAILHPEFLFLFWGTILLGAVAVPVNPETNDETFASIRSRVRPKIILAGIEKETKQKTILFGLPENHPLYRNSYSEAVANYEPLDEFPDASAEQEAVILFTSGSTGEPKGVVLSHGGLFRSGQIMDQAYQWNATDRFLSGGHFHTMSGLRNPCVAVLHSGMSVVIPSEDDVQNPLGILNLCVKQDVTILNVTPAFLAYIGRAQQKAKYFQSNRLRMVISTGSALQPLHREIFKKQFQCPVFDYYGLTETTGACILENPEMRDVEEKGIGKPWECIVKIQEDGELCIYSENLMLGYLGDSVATRNRIRNGWLYTGDTARVNEHGAVILIGRKDRMMVDKNGENVYPEEIERAINKVQGVTDTYVIQYQDTLLVDQIGALVQFDNTPIPLEEKISVLRSALSGKIPTGHIPSLILPVVEIPKGPAGKVSPQEARRLIAAELQNRR